MRAMKTLLVVLVLAALAACGVWYSAGRQAGPQIEIKAPAAVIGQTGDVEVLIRTPHGQLDRLQVQLEQNETRLPVIAFPGSDGAALTRAGEDELRIVRPIGKRTYPKLEAGKARITVTAVRPVLFGYRHVQSSASRDIEVRLTPPALAALSTFHYINQGGSEMVVYRVSPADATSGVRVGNYEYRGYPASAAGVANADPSLHVAFFALLWDQQATTPIGLFARDTVGNEASASFDYRVIPKSFRSSRIQLDDKFLGKVVPGILQSTPAFKVDNPSDLLSSFLRINGDLRRQNGAELEALAAHTAPEVLWRGPFKQLVNSAVEGGFADQRTYVYQGKEVDHQVHLGFDLASTAMTPVAAANRGKVVHAGPFGIYGNCVVIDHGMGLQSLYAHLSSISTSVGSMINEGDVIGRSGSTGLAGGDHLHFTMLLSGHAVTPIDWWSAKWLQDRITRKLQEAQAPATSGASSGTP